jgi:RHS repeat-associated protein
MVVDTAGAAKGWWDYAPFGDEVPKTAGRAAIDYYMGAPIGETPGPGFTGQVRDRLADGLATELDYFVARYFHTGQGRFSSPDAPFVDQHVEDPQRWNMYAYVRNNPTRFVDPSGTACTEDWKDDDRPGPRCIDVLRDDLTGGYEEVAGVEYSEQALFMLGNVGDELGYIGNWSEATLEVMDYASAVRGLAGLFNPRSWIRTTAHRVVKPNPRIGNKAFLGSTRSVQLAVQKLRRGAKQVFVEDAAEAEEIFLGMYNGAGHANTSGMDNNARRILVGDGKHTTAGTRRILQKEVLLESFITFR